MSLFSKLFGRKASTVTVPEEQPLPCLHVGLVPQWNSGTDIGVEARASRFVCPTCAQDFTPDEARALRESEADRLRQTLGS